MNQQTNEEKWRKEYDALVMPGFGNDEDYKHSWTYGIMWEGYLTARKKAQEELDSYSDMIHHQRQREARLNMEIDSLKDELNESERLRKHYENLVIPVNRKNNELKDELKNERAAVDFCESMIGHAVHLEYLGEGSTKGFGLDALEKARSTQAKRKEIL